MKFFSLLQQYEAGVIKYIEKFCLGEKHILFEETTFKSVQLEILLLPFTILILGHILGISILFIEIVNDFFFSRKIFKIKLTGR